MGPTTYPHALRIEGDLLTDMQHFLAGAGAAAVDFWELCEGNPSTGRPPQYAAASRTVARVDNDGQPPPDMTVFDWGGHFFGVPRLRVWFAEQSGQPPRGVGAFLALGPHFPELATVGNRIRALLGAPGCYLTVAP